MNILFITTQPFPNGMAGTKRVRLFAEHLAHQNKVSVIVVGSNNDKNPDKGISKNIEYKFVKFSRWQYFFANKKVKELISQNINSTEKNILFLYDNINITNVLFAKNARKAGYKIVTDIVEDYSLTKENDSIVRKIQYKINNIFQNKIEKYVDGAIVLSSYLFTKYKSLKKIELIPVSAENVNLDFPPKSVKGNVNLVYSGSFGNKDGVVDLIKAFEAITTKYTHVYLKLSGKISESISQLIKNNDKINYLGLIPAEEYYKFLYDADILLMTRVNSSYANAGFPFKLGEYLATGNPVIATKVSDIGNYLTDKTDVIFSKPSDVKSLSNAIAFAIENYESSKAIGLKGKEKCKLYFDPIKNGKQLELFLNTI